MWSKLSIRGSVTFVVFALAAATYLAATIVYGESRPVAENNTPDTAMNFEPLPYLVDDGWTRGPRECDLLQGIDTACLWLD